MPFTPVSSRREAASQVAGHHPWKAPNLPLACCGWQYQSDLYFPLALSFFILCLNGFGVSIFPEVAIMKYGMNLLLWTTHVTAEHFPLLAKLKQAGFDGVELPLFQGDDAHYKKIGQELKKLGLACSAVTICTPETNPVSPDAAIRKKASTHLQWAISTAALLGATNLAGPYHSAIGVFTGTGPTDDEKKRAADVLRGAAEEAKKHNVLLTIEWINRFECYFLTTMGEARALVKQVDHPSFRSMYDTFHAHIEEKNVKQSIVAAADCIAHVHISECDRGIPGTGQIHWNETFQALKQIKYDGWLMIEAFGRALPDLAAATRVWRDLFPSAEDVYTKGLKFMKEQWAK
jgi:D-psicose/D-tagatose/L-ribulose 3-epimerase